MSINVPENFGNFRKMRETLKEFFKKTSKKYRKLKTNFLNILVEIVQNIFGIIFGKTNEKLLEKYEIFNKKKL